MRRQAGQDHRVRLGLGGTAIAFALAVGFGDVAGVVPSSGATTPALPPHPSGAATGAGALPVVPVGGGACIIGLNCGCIRGITCPGTVHHRPAPANAHPHDPPVGPGG
jgi:hypothetical protein